MTPVSLLSPMCLAAALALAQDAQLVPVPQREGDMGGLSTSFRAMPAELRAPTDFSTVYEVPGRPDLLMRGHGALFLLFERSAYVQQRGKVMPIVPSGATYSIGLPSDEPAARRARPETLVDGRTTAAVDPPKPTDRSWGGAEDPLAALPRAYGAGEGWKPDWTATIDPPCSPASQPSPAAASSEPPSTPR